MSSQERSWPVPMALVALSSLPLTAGMFRLIQLAGGPALIPADHRFAGFPLPLVVHLVGVMTYVLVGVLQVRATVPPPAPGLAPSCRSRAGRGRPAGRRLGTVDDPVLRGEARYRRCALRASPGLRVGDGRLSVRGVTAVRRRDIAAHRAWMIRAYAIGLAAGTQAFTGGIGGAIFGTGVLASDLAKVAGWVINLAVAQWAIHRPVHRRLALPAGPQRAGALS